MHAAMYYSLAVGTSIHNGILLGMATVTHAPHALDQ
jgi:hypothetical protein